MKPERDEIESELEERVETREVQRRDASEMERAQDASEMEGELEMRRLWRRRESSRRCRLWRRR